MTGISGNNFQYEMAGWVQGTAEGSTIQFTPHGTHSPFLGFRVGQAVLYAGKRWRIFDIDNDLQDPQDQESISLRYHLHRKDLDITAGGVVKKILWEREMTDVTSLSP